METDSPRTGLIRNLIFARLLLIPVSFAAPSSTSPPRASSSSQPPAHLREHLPLLPRLRRRRLFSPGTASSGSRPTPRNRICSRASAVLPASGSGLGSRPASGSGSVSGSGAASGTGTGSSRTAAAPGPHQNFSSAASVLRAVCFK